MRTARIDGAAAMASDGTVYFGATDKKLDAVGANGVKLWGFATGNSITASPVLGADGTIDIRAIPILSGDGRAITFK